MAFKEFISNPWWFYIAMILTFGFLLLMRNKNKRI